MTGDGFQHSSMKFRMVMTWEWFIIGFPTLIQPPGQSEPNLNQGTEGSLPDRLPRHIRLETSHPESDGKREPVKWQFWVHQHIQRNMQNGITCRFIARKIMCKSWIFQQTAYDYGQV